MKDARGTTKKLLVNSSKITPSLAKPGPARPETIEFYYHFWPFETCVIHWNGRARLKFCQDTQSAGQVEADPS